MKKKEFFGRRGFTEYQLGGVPEDHEKSGRKAEKEKSGNSADSPLRMCRRGLEAVEKTCHCEPVRRLAWQSVIYAGGSSRGQSPPRIKIKCRAKPCLCKACVEAKNDYFRAARRHKNRTLSGCRKKPESFRQPCLRRPFQAVCKREIALLWRCWPHTCGQEVML